LIPVGAENMGPDPESAQPSALQSPHLLSINKLYLQLLRASSAHVNL
jgi:hypothetical protein